MYALPVRIAFPSPASRKIFRKPFLFGYKKGISYFLQDMPYNILLTLGDYSLLPNK